MVHGILQFTPSIAFRYVLHRCESLDIRCRESYLVKRQCCRRTLHVTRDRGLQRARQNVYVILDAIRAGV